MINVDNVKYRIKRKGFHEAKKELLREHTITYMSILEVDTAGNPSKIYVQFADSSIVSFYM